MNIKLLSQILRRHFVEVIVGALLGLLAAYGWMSLQAKTYTATSTAYVSAGAGSTSGDAFQAAQLAQLKAKSWEPIFSSRAVAERVVKRLKLSVDASSVASRVKVTLPSNDVNLLIQATGPTPTEARDLADAVVEETAAYVKILEPPQAPPDGGTPLEVKIAPVASAALPSSPTSPLPQRYLPVGLLLGSVAGFLAAWAAYVRDTRMRSGADIDKAAQVGLLGPIPRSPVLTARPDSHEHEREFAVREALRKLRTNLRFADVDGDPRAIVVTSSSMSEGKSTVASHLAVVLAEAGEKVVLVDADLRRPALASRFELEGVVGLTQVLSGSISVADALQATKIPGLSFLAAGPIPPNPSEMLGSLRMQALIEELKSSGYVLFDASPLLPVTDAAILGHACDGTIVVVAANKTRTEDLTRAVQSLRAVGAKVLGTVLNMTSTRRLDRFRYGDSEYGSKYGYGYGTTPYHPDSRRSRAAK